MKPSEPNKLNNPMDDSIRNELHGINMKLQANNAMLETHIALTKEHLNGHEERIARHARELYGNGEGEIGIKLTLDRLNETEKGRKWLIGTIVTAVIALVLKAFYSMIGRN